MTGRFCPQCGTQALPRAKFCSECGTALGGAPAPRARPRSTAGFAVFGGLLLTGLGIWAAILSPDPPPPPLGATRAGGTAGGGAAAQPQQPRTVPLPEEITKMVADLAAKAASRPDDLPLWVHLGEVYSRTGQFDASYYPKALAAYEHVLAREPKHAEAIRGKANVHYDRNEPKEAIPLFERYLALRGEDASVRTDLATMHFYDGDTEKAIAMYKAVLAKDPGFVQAHYNLAAAYHAQGDVPGALAELRTARGLASDERVRQQIDQMVARLSGAPAGDVPTASPAAERTPFQDTVERELRGHQIVGPRITAIRWTAPGTAEVRVREFPMTAMPPMARAAFDKRMVGYLNEANAAHPVTGERAITIVDATTGEAMATITP
jgi:cytochrome c-type biogenesis protein CcmH/NrfG